MNCLICNDTFENEWLLEIHRLKTHVDAPSKCHNNQCKISALISALRFSLTHCQNLLIMN